MGLERSAAAVHCASEEDRNAEPVHYASVAVRISVCESVRFEESDLLADPNAVHGLERPASRRAVASAERRRASLAVASAPVESERHHRHA